MRNAALLFDLILIVVSAALVGGSFCRYSYTEDFTMITGAIALSASLALVLFIRRSEVRLHPIIALAAFGAITVAAYFGGRALVVLAAAP